MEIYFTDGTVIKEGISVIHLSVDSSYIIYGVEDKVKFFDEREIKEIKLF